MRNSRISSASVAICAKFRRLRSAGEWMDSSNVPMVFLPQEKGRAAKQIVPRRGGARNHLCQPIVYQRGGLEPAEWLDGGWTRLGATDVGATEVGATDGRENKN